MSRSHFFLALMLALFPTASRTQIVLATPFRDGAVLQRGKPAAVKRRAPLLR